ncbi:MAG: hypothetical protein ABSB67_06090 [Bryobacteraceae bacterium]|jgi:uncharacterized protein involved in exopolysaccharide biosynthesis
MPITEERAFRERTLYVVVRWRFLVAAVVTAGLLALGVSELMPRLYTATSTVIIDPPATNDPRTTTALNPTYLDSLTTFERYFTSDTLFQEAAQRFHLDTGRAGVTAVRKSVLKVSVQHQTRILEVSATLPDPKDAIVLVQYITQRSIEASREEALAGDQDSLRNVTEDMDRARSRLEAARSAWEQVAHDDTPETLRSEVSAAISLHTETLRLHEEAVAETAQWRARAQDGDAEDRESGTILSNAAAARATEYAKREKELAGEIDTKRKLVAQKTMQHAIASAELDSAQKAYDAAFTRVRDYTALTGMHSERMHVIDPGVEPRQPSSPKVLLNTIAAALLAALIGLAWLNFMAGMPKQRPSVVRVPAALHEERTVSR